jgi:DNA (cytosine-5)-methyltransferase 1
MSYTTQLNHQPRPQPSTAYRVLDLFAGCGGLSLGFEAAGFHSVGYEMDERAADTYSKNLKGPCHAQKLSIETEYDNGLGSLSIQPSATTENLERKTPQSR